MYCTTKKIIFNYISLIFSGRFPNGVATKKEFAALAKEIGVSI